MEVMGGPFLVRFLPGGVMGEHLPEEPLRFPTEADRAEYIKRWEEAAPELEEVPPVQGIDYLLETDE